ncbi:hypothetical protein D3C78_301870 [compost metagenome]
MQFKDLRFTNWNDLIEFLNTYFTNQVDDVSELVQFTQFDVEVGGLCDNRPEGELRYQSTCRVFIGAHGDVFIGREILGGDDDGKACLYDMGAEAGADALADVTRDLILESMTKRFVPAELLSCLNYWRNDMGDDRVEGETFEQDSTAVIEKTRKLLSFLQH